jgi:UDP-3-O-[3-hydroxymyristoyl] glucosamine N-acyltransferase
MPISLGQLATQFGCDLVGDPDVVINKIATLSNAGEGALTFLASPAYLKQLSATTAAAVILREADAAACPTAALIAKDPYATYARMAAVVHPSATPAPGIHASAVVAESADVAPSAHIAANAVVGERSRIGARTSIGAGTVIGDDCVLGDDCRLHANVTLVRAVVMGDRCIMHSGAVIGGDGFGNAMTPEGWLKVPQLGGVKIGSDVEIGCNSTVDCGAIDDTVIGDGVRIDNLCQIAHNVLIGDHTAMAATAAIAGSAVIGKRCMFAGQSGTVGHITVCDDVIVSGCSVLSKDIQEPGVYSNFFAAEKIADWNRQVARLRRLDKLMERVKKLEQDKQ